MRCARVNFEVVLALGADIQVGFKSAFQMIGAAAQALDPKALGANILSAPGPGTGSVIAIFSLEPGHRNYL